jgi:hypothetical protein
MQIMYQKTHPGFILQDRETGPLHIDPWSGHRSALLVNWAWRKALIKARSRSSDRHCWHFGEPSFEFFMVAGA